MAENWQERLRLQDAVDRRALRRRDAHDHRVVARTDREGCHVRESFSRSARPTSSLNAFHAHFMLISCRRPGRFRRKLKRLNRKETERMKAAGERGRGGRLLRLLLASLPSCQSVEGAGAALTLIALWRLGESYQIVHDDGSVSIVVGTAPNHSPLRQLRAEDVPADDRDSPSLYGVPE